MFTDSTLIFSVVFFLFIAALIIRLIFPLIWKKYSRRQRLKATMRLIHSRGEAFDHSLQKHNRFYRHLSAPCKKRFMQRTIEFMRLKEFKYYELEKDENIALLVSSAAIQISFGLENYLLEYFQTIHVLRTDYHYGNYNTPFMGHVNSSGIYFSWYNFIKGFDDYGDAHNVGLHEMAHALAYVNFVAKGEGQDGRFKRRFEDFSRVARPIYNSMKAGTTTVLDKYAATDFQEFWAVSVETFFEKPKELKTKMPELYLAICELLNLDPLSADTVLKTVS